MFLCNTDERKEAVWTVRGASLEALKASTTDMDECDIVVPRNRIADFSKFAGTKVEETGTRISIQGHAGDGNMHIQDVYKRQTQNCVFVKAIMYK